MKPEAPVTKHFMNAVALAKGARRTKQKRAADRGRFPLPSKGRGIEGEGDDALTPLYDSDLATLSPLTPALSPLRGEGERRRAHCVYQSTQKYLAQRFRGRFKIVHQQIPLYAQMRAQPGRVSFQC